MSKETTTITLDSELKQRAKDMGLNVSQIAEKAIRDKSGLIEVDTSTDLEKCGDCGKEQKKATRDDMEGLKFLYPNEIWICNNCLTKRGVVSQ